MLILALDRGEQAARPEDADVAKAIVMAEFARLVERGVALIITLESGTRKLRLATGEVFHLGEETITRIA